MYNLNYTLTNLGYNVEGKLHEEVHEHRWLNTTILHIRLTDSDEVVRPIHWPPYTARKIAGTHFMRG
jgi:hypothetical protein